MIVVCPTAHAVDLARERSPSRVLGFAAPGDPVPDLGFGRRLVLRFHDIDEPRPGLVAPSEADVASLLAFGDSWGGEGILLVHCQMGISRSTAAAFILACRHDPARSEGAVADALRAGSPSATPNPLMISLADALLGRSGRMVAAVRAIGRGADYRPYGSFALPLAARSPL